MDNLNFMQVHTVLLNAKFITEIKWRIIMGATRKPGGGRKKLKPEYDAGKNMKE